MPFQGQNYRIIGRYGKKNHAHPRVVSLLQHGYRLDFKILPKLSKIPLILSEYYNKNKDGVLHKAVQAMLTKKAITHVRKPTTLGYYSRLFLVPKPMKRWRPVIDRSMLNNHLYVPTFKMETAESIRKLIRKGEWITSIDLTDAYFHVPISDQKSGFPILGTPFWCSNSSPRVYSYWKRSKTHSSSQEPQNPSISGRLAFSVTHNSTRSHRFSKLGKIGARISLEYQFSKVRIGTHAKSGFSRLPLRSSEGSSLSNPKEARSVKRSDCFHQKVFSLDSKKAHVAHRDFSFLRENSTTRKVTHETFPVVPEVTLEISPVTGQKYPSNREFSETSQMVGGSTESHGSCSYPSSYSQHIGIHRCLSKGLGCSLKRDSVKWPLVKQGNSASHQCTGAKSCLSGPKGSSGALTGSKSAHLFRQQHGSILSEQRRRHTFHRNVCSYLENSGIHKFQKDPDKSKTHTWIPECDSRLPITKGQGHTNRVVPSSTDIQPNLQSLAHTQW